jgi:hypothetical protein
MELRRHIDVIWRYRGIVAGGIVLGIALAVLVAFKPSWDGGPKLKWRSAETYSSESTLFLTQSGFPWGRANYPAPPRATDTSQAAKVALGAQFADPSRFSDLATLYPAIIRGSAVRALIPGRPPADRISAAAELTDANGTKGALPLVTLKTKAATAPAARALNAATVRALQTFLLRQQTANNVPPNQRVQASVLNPPARATLLNGRALSAPIAAFLLIMVTGVALAYVLENLRPVEQPGSNGNGNGNGSNAHGLVEVWSPSSIAREPAKSRGATRGTARKILR